MYKYIIKNILSFITLISAIFLFIYLVMIFNLVSISIIVLLFFIYLIVINLIIFFIINHPIDYKVNKPSFFYIFFGCLYIVTILVLGVYLIYNILYSKYYTKFNENYHYVIVFGATIKTDNNKNFVIDSRIEEAINIAKKNKNTKFVLTGGKGIDEIESEAVYMKKRMIENGINENMILIDDKAINTFENINNSLNLIQNDILYRNRFEQFITKPYNVEKKLFDLGLINIGFVSNEYHIQRIVMMAINKGINEPCCVAVKTRPLYLLYYYAREFLAFVKAFSLSQITIFRGI